MRKKFYLTAGRNFKKIRKDLGILQDELRIEGVIQNISEFETGVKRVSDTVGMALIERIKKIAKEKDYTFEYEVTLEVLQGKINIVRSDILKRLENGANDKLLREIDIDLMGKNDEEAIQFIVDAIEIMWEDDVRKNGVFIKQYSLKLLNYDLGDELRARAYAFVVGAYCSLKKYEEAIEMAIVAEYEINKANNIKVKVSYYSNMAMAYFEQHLYDESMDLLKKIKSFGKSYADNFFCLTLEADIMAMKKKFKKAEKMYFEILKRAEKENNQDYIVNTLSNIADLYRKQNMNNESKIYIDKALIKLNFRVSDIHKLNVYYNAVLIHENEFELLENYFSMALTIAIEIKNIEKIQLLVRIMFNKYIERKDYDKIYNTITKIRGFNIQVDVIEEAFKSVYMAL